MKQLDFDRAFPQTPDCIHAAIEMGFRKGKKQMKLQHKIISLGSIAAAIAIMIAVAAFAAGGLGTPPKPDVLAQPKITDIPKPTEEPMVWCIEDPMVWCTEKGNYYHSDEHCSGMEGAVYGTLSYALALDKGPCPVCTPTEYDGQSGKEPIEFIYYSEDSQYFHKDQTCTGETYPLKTESLNTYFAVTDAAVNKAPCPVCLPYGITMIGDGAYVNLHKIPEPTTAPAPEEEKVTVYAVYGQARYYHKSQVCNKQQNNRSLTLANAEKEQLIPCPDCYGMTAAESTDVVFYCTPSGKYYHLEPDCSGMLNAKACTPEQVFINSGYTACPSCIDTDEEKALLMLPIPQDDTDEVFIAPSNDYYHRDHGCFYMSMVIKADLKSAKDMGHTPCPMCLSDQVDLSTFETCWATKNGKYYHSDEHCSGMQNAVSGLVEEAQSKGKMRCPVCMKITPENYDLFTTAFGQEIEDLYHGYIYEYTNYGFEWNISNGTEIFRLCDVHPQGTAFFGEELPGLPELHLHGLTADPEQVHAFMEAAPAPIGSMYAEAPAEMEKALRHSKLTAEELQLQEVVVYFDANRQVSACEMQFGFGDHVKLKWQVNANGEIELTEGDFVDIQWG